MRCTVLQRTKWWRYQIARYQIARQGSRIFIPPTEIAVCCSVLQCVAVKADFNGKSKTVWLLLVQVTESCLDEALFRARHAMYVHVYACIFI